MHPNVRDIGFLCSNESVFELAVLLFPKQIDIRIDLLEEVAVVGAQIAGTSMSFQHMGAARLFVHADRFAKVRAQQIHAQNVPLQTRWALGILLMMVPLMIRFKGVCFVELVGPARSC